MNIRIGDYIESNRHGHRGRVYELKRLTNADADWVAAQRIPVTIEQLQEVWVGVLVHEGGAILTPMSACRKIRAIKGFKHPYAKEHFP